MNKIQLDQEKNEVLKELQNSIKKIATKGTAKLSAYCGDELVSVNSLPDYNGYSFFVENKGNTTNRLTISYNEKRVSIKTIEGANINKLIEIAKKRLDLYIKKNDTKTFRTKIK